MQERYTSNGVIDRGYAIYDEWNENKYKSRKIVNSVQMAVAFTNAIKTPESYTEALSHLFALDLRIGKRYTNVLTCIMFYFSWRRETGEMKRLRGMMELPNIKDFRALIEVELERLREKMGVDSAEGENKRSHGGKVNSFAEENPTATAIDPQSDASAEETLEEIRDAEKSEEKNEELGDPEPTEEQANEEQSEKTEKTEKSKEYREGAAKAQEDGDDTVLEDNEETRQEKNHKNKLEDKGPAEKRANSIDKIENNNGYGGYNGAIDIPFVYEEMPRSETSGTVNFIDEVIIDNMIKGEDDIIGHNPLEGVKQNGADNPQADDAPIFENNNEDGKDAHLYDKMVLNFKDTGMRNVEKAPQEKALNVPNPQSDKAQIAENKEPVPVYNKPDSMRIQINIQDNISEENAFRRSVNDQFTAKMIIFQKSLMENALRDEFIIACEEFGSDAPINNIIEKGNFEDLHASVASVRNH